MFATLERAPRKLAAQVELFDNVLRMSDKQMRMVSLRNFT